MRYRYAVLKPTEFGKYSTGLHFRLLRLKMQKTWQEKNGRLMVRPFPEGDFRYPYSLSYRIQSEENFYLFRYKAVAIRRLEELKRLVCML